MSTLTGRKIANSYKNLLQVETSNTDLDTSLRSVQTGAGNSTPLQLSTDKINLTGTLQINGTTLTAGAATLNAVADLTGATGLVAVSAGNIHGRSIAVGNPLTISNANGTEGNPTINLASSGVSAATYGPMVNFTVDNFGRITDVTVTTTISANAFVGGTISGSALTIENDTSIDGDVVIEGTTNMKAISATDVTFNNLTVNTKINAVTVTATTIETSILRATTISVTDLTADNINFENVSVSSLVANVASVGKFNGNMTIESTADGGPILTLVSNDPNDAGSFNNEGIISFKAENDADQQVEYAQIRMVTADETDGTEDGRLVVALQRGGSGVVNGYQLSSNILFLEHDDHIIRWNQTKNTSFNVNLNTATPSATRTITLPDATGTVLLDTGNQTLTGDLTILSTDTGASEDPNLILYRNSSSPADNDATGTIQFQGRNDNSQDVIYGEIQSSMLDVSDGAEDGSLSFQTRKAGTQTTYITLSGASGRVNILQELFLGTGNNIKFEGATSNANETTITVTDPTADRTITLPDATGTVTLLTATQTLTNKTLTSPTINGFSGTGDASITGNLTLTSTDAGATEDPSLILYRNSSSPAIDDELGEIVFRGRNDNSEDIDYAKVYTEIKDETDGTESGALKFEVMKDGTLASFMTMNGEANQMYINKKFNMQNNNILNIGYLTFEGSTSDTNETTLAVTDPTADRTITLPDATGTVLVDDGSGNVAISGNLTVSGTTTTVNSSTLSVQDPLIILANNNNSSDVVDIGFYGLYDTSGSQDLYAGLFRDASDSGKFKLFKDLQVEPTTTVNTSGTGYAVGTLVANLEGTIQTAAQTNITSLGTLTGLTIDGDTTFTGANGNIVFDKSDDALEFADNVKAVFGTGSDLIIRHEVPGNHSVIRESGSGSLFIDASDLQLRSGDFQKYAVFTLNGSAELYYDNVKKFETRSNGFAYIDSDVTVEITNQGNQGAIEVGGTSGAFIDLKSPASDDYDARIQVNSSNLFAIYSDDLHLASKTAETYLDATANGSVNLYYDNVKTFETTADGIKVTAPNLGTSDGDTETVADFHINNGNGSSLRINKIRDGNGTNWNTSATKIQQVIDSTFQGYLQFNGNDNQYGLELGTVSDEKFFRGVYNGAVELYHNNSLRFLTTSTGAKVTGGTGDGTLIIESDTDNATEEDNALLQLTQDGGLVTVDFGFDANNNILIKGNGSAANVHLQHGDELLAKGIADGAFELYHDNVKKFETTASGAKISGGTGDAVLTLEADTTNTDEDDNAFIQFSQDGGGVTAQAGTDGNNRFFIQTTTGTGTTKFDITGGLGTRLYHSTNVKLETTSIGATVTGTLVSDVISIADGSSTQDRLTIGTNDDFFIYHDGQTVIANKNSTGPIKIQARFGEQSIVLNQDEGVQLYYNNSKVFETTSTGVTIEDPSDSSASKSLRIIGKRSDANDSYAFSGKLMLATNRTDQLLDTGKTIGIIGFGGNHTDGTVGNILYSSAITGVSEGDFNSATDMPTGLAFFTGSTGRDPDTPNVTINTERMRIDKDGNVGIGTTTPSTKLEVAGDLTTDEVFLGNTTDHKIGKTTHSYGDGIGLTTDNGTVTIGQGNSSYMHYVNSNTVPHWFSNSVVANGGFSVWGTSDNLGLKNGGIIWEGATSDSSQTTLNVTDPTADRTITLPDASGTVLLNAGNQTLTGDLTFPDNEQAIFGTGNDLKIFHSGSNSFIQEGGTGDLYIQSATVNITDTSSTPSGKFIDGGAVELYHNGNKKFETRSGGVTITGNLQFAETHGSDSNTQIFTEQAISQQTSLVLQTGDDATTNNEDDVIIRHRNYGNATPQDLDMAIFKRNVSDNSKADITFNGDVTLLSTDAGATAAPTLSLYRNSASPASSDDIGQIQWFAENDADEKVEYARIDVRNAGVTDGAEYGQMDFMVLNNGGETVPFRLSFNLVQFYRDLYIGAAYKIQFEGNAYNDFETSLTVAGPTADRTITLPDATGQVVLSSGAIDTDATAEIGRAHIGYMGASDMAGFSHVDHNSTTNYALIQTSVGRTLLNAPTGQDIVFGINDQTIGSFYSNGLHLTTGKSLSFEGATANDFETYLTVTDPTADRTITLPNASGTVITTGNSNTPTTTTSSSDADFVLIDDGGTMKKITPSNLGIGSGGGGGSFNGTLTSTDAGETAAPILTLDRNSASPADGDFLGDVQFKGRNDAGEEIIYGSMGVKIEDVTDGTEDSRLLYKIQKAGELKTVLDIKADQFKINNVSEVFFGDPVSALKFEGATGDDFELTLAITDPTADRTVTIPDATGTLNISVFADFYYATAGTSLATATTIPFDNQRQNSNTNIFSNSSGEITINHTAVFQITFSISTNETAGSRTDSLCFLEEYNGSSWSEVAGTRGYIYNRNSTEGEGTATVNIQHSVTSGRKYRVRAQKGSGGGTIVTSANGSRFSFLRVG